METLTPNPDYPPPPKLNLEDYNSDLEGFDLTPEQQKELLETLWNIMVSFTDLGFGSDTVSLALRAICGEELADFPLDEQNELYSPHPTQNEFNNQNLEASLALRQQEES